MKLDVREHARLIRDEGIFYEVFVNGENVTSHCFAAEDGPNGWVDCFKADANGRHYVVVLDSERQPATEHLTGNVEFRKREATADEEERNAIALHPIDTK